ncbi:hypothetical protein SEA_CONLEY_50 [Gordonia phage Conley]|nr:hypothetical protein SEA_CONLEY_50 [Gordonia phage Conley]
MMEDVAECKNCDDFSCRACEHENRMTDILMGTTRKYTKSTLPPSESLRTDGGIFHLNLMSSGRSRMSRRTVYTPEKGY